MQVKPWGTRAGVHMLCHSLQAHPVLAGTAGPEGPASFGANSSTSLILAILEGKHRFDLSLSFPCFSQLKLFILFSLNEQIISVMFSSMDYMLEGQKRFDPALQKAAGAELCELPLHRVRNEVRANDPVASRSQCPSLGRC